MKNYLLMAAISSMALTVNANEYKFIFDGENSMGGLPRQTDEKNLEYVDGFSLSSEGIDFNISKTDGTGNGYALVNAGGDKAGIFVSSQIDTKIELTVPNGKITAAKIIMTGYALTSLELNFNGKEVESNIETPKYYWEWSEEEGTENLTIEWPKTFMARYIHSIELTYTSDLGGKLDSGLSFDKKATEAILGESFSTPTLINPHNLSVTWSSSVESVATVNQEGDLTLLQGGTTVITASTDGNDEYAPRNAKYELTVIPSAQDILQLKEMAPNVYERVKVNFPATVTYANGGYAYVIDEEGNAGCFYDTVYDDKPEEAKTIYKVGNVIPAGWIATNATIHESEIWQGRPGKVTENVEVTYPKVSSVTPADADRVVILMNVKFETSTALENTRAYGTTPDNTRYEFQDTFNAPSMPAGKYDVTCVVIYSKVQTTEYFYLAPISYKESSEETDVESLGINETEVYYYDLSGKRINNPNKGLYIKIENNKTTKVIVK